MSDTNGGIFISHSHDDREIALRIAHDLMDQKFNVWLDRLNINPSEDWSNKIEEGLDKSSLLVVIWNKNAKESKWVLREIARAERKDKFIIPLLFDDTDIDFHLERREYLDFRKGWFNEIQKLFVFLQRLVQQQNQAELFESPWRWVPEPDLRNKFLYENHYSIDITQNDFGRNEWTNRVVQYDLDQSTEIVRYVSIVAVPLVRSREVDFEKLKDYLGLLHHLNSGTRKVNPDQPRYRQIPLDRFREHRILHRDYVRFDQRGSSPQELSRFLRISQDGGIEFVDAERLFVNVRENLWALQYVGLLGLTWQMIHFALDIFTELLDYNGPVQCITNVIGAWGVCLGYFAQDTQRYWYNPWDRRFDQDSLSKVKCLNRNLQFVYEIDLAHFQQIPNVSQSLIEDLGFRLQRCFNLIEVKPTHYIPETEIFPWDQYFNAIW